MSDDQPARLTDARLAEIRAREQAATPGPWRVGSPQFRCVLDHGKGSGGHGTSACRYTYQDWWIYDGIYQISVDESFTSESLTEDAQDAIAGTWNYDEGGVKRREDADFIAHARSDIPALLDRVERAETALTGLRRACHLEMPEGERLSQSGYVCALCLWDADPDDPATHEPTCPLFVAAADGEAR